MAKPRPYSADVVVPLPDDAELMALLGDAYHPDTALNVMKMVTSPTAGSRRILLTRLAREGPVQPGGCCARPSRLLGCDASIAGRRSPIA